MTKYVAYLRISTKKQLESGLGLEDQRKTIEKAIGPDDKIAFWFTEAESGTKCDRPELNKAIEACKDVGATLIVARVDRLARNAKFLFTLRDSGLPLFFCDMPFADEFSIGIMALYAEWWVKRSNRNIKAAFEAKRRRGEKMGNIANLTREGGIKGNQVMRAKFLAKVDVVKPTILYMLEQKTPTETIITNIKSFYPNNNYSTDFIRRAISEVKVQRSLQD